MDWSETMTESQEAAIRAHGIELQRIFPATAGEDPVRLCKRLRRIERDGNDYATRLCCEDVPEDEQERIEGRILDRVRMVLVDHDGRVWLNRDPRGYALKIDLQGGETLHRDWGGYGIIAPEIGPKGQ